MTSFAANKSAWKISEKDRTPPRIGGMIQQFKQQETNTMPLTKTQLLAQYEAQVAHLKIKAAHDLEAELSGNQAVIRQHGLVYVKDEEGNTTRFEANYSAEELLQLLDRGMDIREAIKSLGAEILLG